MSTTLPTSVAKSPLFKLPPELRIQIYEYAARMEPQQFRDFMPGASRDWAKNDAVYGVRERALLATCRIIRTEAMATFRASPCYHIQVITRFESGNSVTLWRYCLEDLFSSYIIDGRDIDTNFLEEGHRDWDIMTEWLRDAQKKFLAGQTERMAGGMSWRGDGFGYEIKEINPTKTITWGRFWPTRENE